jgi:CCR4-NOT transcription complex subunit 1
MAQTTTEQAALRAFETAGSVSVQGVTPGAPAEHLRLAVEKCAAVISKAEEIVLRSPQLASSPLLSLPQGHELTQLILQSRALILQATIGREEIALGYAQKVLRRMYDSSKFGRCTLGLDWMLTMLTALNDITKRVSKDLAGWLVTLDGDRRFNRELTVSLVSSHLLNLNSPDYVKEILKHMDMGRNLAAVEFVVSILQHCLVDKRYVTTQECVGLLDALSKIAQALRPKAPDAIIKLLDDARTLARIGAPLMKPGDLVGKTPVMPAGAGVVGLKTKSPQDPPGLREQVKFTADKWLQIVSHPP